MHGNGFLLPKVFNKAEKPAFKRVFQIVLVGIGLALETNVLIAPIKTKAKKATDQPFKNIDDIEGNDQQFHLLFQMYPFMIDKHAIFFQAVIF